MTRPTHSGGSHRLPWNVENAPHAGLEHWWHRSASYSTRERAVAEVAVWKAIYQQRAPELERRWRVRNRDTGETVLL